MQGQPTKICSLTTGPKLDRAVLHGRAQGLHGLEVPIVGLDILDEQNVNKTIKYLKSFLRHASPDPKIIGFHNYSDTNRFSTTRTKRVLAAFRGKVWLTETGGIVKLGSSVPVQHEPRAPRRWAACSRLAKSNSRIQRAVRLPVQPAAGPVDGVLRRRPHQPGQLDAPGLRRGQEPQGAQLPQVGH